MTERTTKTLDKLWGEIRQLVLDEGPAAERVDAEMASRGMPAELRESLVSNLIALRCVEICRLTPGKYDGAHPADVLADWAGVMIAAGMRGDH